MVGGDLARLTWTAPYTGANYVTGFKVHVLDTRTSGEQVAKCWFENPTGTDCVMMLGDLRVSPFNL